MKAGDVPGVRALASADDLRVPPPPGVAVVPAADPWREAGRLARALGAARVLTATEACDELDRRHAAAVAEARRHAAHGAREAEAARRRAGAARAALPPGMAVVSPGELRRAAEAVGTAASAVWATRAALGPRPRVDEEVARDAREAQVLVDLARLQRAAQVPRANRVVMAANAGAAGVVVGRLVSDAFDPVFVLVAVLPVAGLGIAASMLGHSVRRARSAARRRWAALRSLDVCTLAELEAREAEARAWDARAAQVAAQRRDLARTQAAWTSLAGPAVPVADVAAAADALEEVAALDAEAEAAAGAWRDAAERLQAAEDAGGTGPGLVVVVDGSHAVRSRHLRALAESAGRSAVVVVSVPGSTAPDATAEPAEPAGPAPAADPVPGAGASGHGVVDLGERVRAGLLRLRSRQPPRRDPSPPGSVASG